MPKKQIKPKVFFCQNFRYISVYHHSVTDVSPLFSRHRLFDSPFGLSLHWIHSDFSRLMLAGNGSYAPGEGQSRK